MKRWVATAIRVVWKKRKLVVAVCVVWLRSQFVTAVGAGRKKRQLVGRRYGVEEEAAGRCRLWKERQLATAVVVMWTRRHFVTAVGMVWLKRQLVMAAGVVWKERQLITAVGVARKKMQMVGYTATWHGCGLVHRRSRAGPQGGVEGRCDIAVVFIVARVVWGLVCGAWGGVPVGRRSRDPDGVGTCASSDVVEGRVWGEDSVAVHDSVGTGESAQVTKALGKLPQEGTRGSGGVFRETQCQEARRLKTVRGRKAGLEGWAFSG